MTRSTEAEKRLQQLKRDVRSCHDPFDLAAEALLDNERLRRRINRCNCQE